MASKPKSPKPMKPAAKVNAGLEPGFFTALGFPKPKSGKGKAKPATQTKAQIEAELKAQRHVKTEAARVAFERSVIEAFICSGFLDPRPRENILTRARWLERGYRVRPGQHAVWVKAPWTSEKSEGYPLYSAAQVEAI